MIPPLPRGEMLDFTELFGLALFGLIFQIGVPALSVPAWLLGLQARSDWAARHGRGGRGHGDVRGLCPCLYEAGDGRLMVPPPAPCIPRGYVNPLLSGDGRPVSITCF